MDVRFPDDTLVRASGLAARDSDDGWRAYGLYCDARWQPTWPATTIDWPDFGLPAEPQMAATQIVAAFRRARQGEHAEVGCLGGIGRTGTVLACMAVIAGVPGTDAVTWIREHYRPEAVETAGQADWVIWFAEWLGAQSS